MISILWCSLSSCGYLFPSFLFLLFAFFERTYEVTNYKFGWDGFFSVLKNKNIFLSVVKCARNTDFFPFFIHCENHTKLDTWSGLFSKPKRKTEVNGFIGIVIILFVARVVKEFCIRPLYVFKIKWPIVFLKHSYFIWWADVCVGVCAHFANAFEYWWPKR